MRENFIQEMYKDGYGPKNGPEEVFGEDHNPYIDYICGVIVPKDCDLGEEQEQDSSGELSTMESEGSGEDYEDEFELPATSELNPRQRPKSFGISFVVDRSEIIFDICLTWGRYFKNNDDLWQREPYHKIIEDYSLSNDVQKHRITDSYGELILHFKKVEKDSKFIIMIILVNNSICNADEFDSKVSKSIYQPSIRIIIKNNAILRNLQGDERPEELLYFLYRNRPVLARGFMCAAVWKDIDYYSLTFQDYFLDWKILWADGHYFQVDCEKFIECDVRSEFVPLYPVTAPIFEWEEGKYGTTPELRTSILSEMWDKEEIDKYLQPFVDGYNRWIDTNRQDLANLTAQERQRANELITIQEEMIKRVESGIQLLKTDEEVRLAFCFANKVLWQSHKWSRNADLIWRPFQLAFFLTNLESLSNENSKYRDYIDLLWIPTGGGKTEAYLAIMAFTIAFRRRRYYDGELMNLGVSVITRYTLRLLTIQQFRRTLVMVTSAEYHRIFQCQNSGLRGWRPEKSNNVNNWIWGTGRFSVGMWVGAGVSPNHLRTPENAISILMNSVEKPRSEPAQVLACPCCSTWLAIPKSGLEENKRHSLFLIVGWDEEDLQPIRQNLTNLQNFNYIQEYEFHEFNSLNNLGSLHLILNSETPIIIESIDDLGQEIQNKIGLRILSFRASRPGYFGCPPEPGRRRANDKPYDFEIFCPNPHCDLNTDLEFMEGVPHRIDQNSDDTPDGLYFIDNRIPFLENKFMPIPAYMIDEQIYSRCPSIIVSTADKIARLAWEPRVASIFGNVNGYNRYYGFLRDDLWPKNPTKSAKNETTQVSQLPPPDLIIQDELHLIEGPLGSMFGSYELVLSAICEENGRRLKYIASTATIKRAQNQVKKLFAKDNFQFPPYGLDIDDSFFVKSPSRLKAWREDRPGRIYMGLAAFGRGSLTPIKILWARLLKTGQDMIDETPNIRYFWTIVGFYNAIRELAGSVALYKEDIIDQLEFISNGVEPRILDESRIIELSSRIDSTNLPQVLSKLENFDDANINNNPDAIFTTSMFGTGVDIPHLSLMLVLGQPKTTSQYIQATGRVGRSHGGLVLTFFKVSKPRGLNHYEMFSTFHHRIYLEVEPVSVSPFSRGVLKGAAGPILVSYLRNMLNPHISWPSDDATIIANQNSNIDIERFINRLKVRLNLMMNPRKIPEIINYFHSEKDKWANHANIIPELKFLEYVFKTNEPRYDVVLGDTIHELYNKVRVYEKAPQSLREVEETIGFRVW